MDGERHAAVVGCHRLDVGDLLYAIGGKIHRGHVARQPADRRILMLIHDNETFACGLHAPPSWATSIAVVPEDRLFGASMLIVRTCGAGIGGCSAIRSEERRVGTEGVMTGRFRWCL